MNTWVRRIGCGLLAAGMLLGASGCADPGTQRREKFGKTFYLDGAGNLGFGASDVPSGLRRAGYRGDVEIYMWTTSLNPLVDQLNIPAARFRASVLADKIIAYQKQHPENQINVIALSAGTGVATWAIEELKGRAKVNNLILLGSSLSNDYDMSTALQNMTGRIYVYYSPNDAVLEIVKLVGTIDGKRGVPSVGQVGLKAPPGQESRIVNIGWNEEWTRFGWAGTHTDCTSGQFVQVQISKHIVAPVGTASTGERPINPPRSYRASSR
ncbi:MAG: hypothetical protein FLDDKLPJ_00881 [Phycisphaerae bacterium]|nr:hypothetical protein [Phycisphaerae bacterium]